MITATKKVITYAEVFVPGVWCDFRVWSNGKVEFWNTSDENVMGYWEDYCDSGDHYDEIKNAGLSVLTENN